MGACPPLVPQDPFLTTCTSLHVVAEAAANIHVVTAKDVDDRNVGFVTLQDAPLFDFVDVQRHLIRPP